jgi:exopolysaccharide biosynthesis protein
VITHTRIRVRMNKVEEAPKGFKYWRYPKWLGWTDIRFLVIDPLKHDIEFDYDLAKTVSQIAKANRAIAAWNFPFFYQGKVIGFVHDDRDVRTVYTPKSEQWSEFYLDLNNQPHVTDEYKKANEAKFIIQGAPRLIRNGQIVVDKQIKVEQIAPDIANGSAPRSAVGIRKDGQLVVCVVDGRSKWDKGLTLHELAVVMQWLGCVEALNGDGGGSSTLYYNGKVENAVSDGKERVVNHAVYIKPRRYP